MYLILPGHSLDSSGENCACELAIVEIDHERVEWLLVQIDTLIKLHQDSEEGPSWFVYWDASPIWVRIWDELEGVPDVTGRGIDPWEPHPQVVEHIEIPEGAKQRTETDMLWVYFDSIYWHATPKHSGITVETCEVPVALLRELGSGVKT